MIGGYDTLAKWFRHCILFILYGMNNVDYYNKILSRCVKNDNWCLERKWACNDSLYWVIKIDWKFRYVHRFIYEHINGIPEWFTVDHKCKNTKCCNIDHLWLHTKYECSSQWWQTRANDTKKTFCDKHNCERVYNEKKQRYYCKYCANETTKKWYKKNKDKYNRVRREKRKHKSSAKPVTWVQVS